MTPDVLYQAPLDHERTCATCRDTSEMCAEGRALLLAWGNVDAEHTAATGTTRSKEGWARQRQKGGR